jgi:hypothetical protein
MDHDSHVIEFRKAQILAQWYDERFWWTYTPEGRIVPIQRKVGSINH